MKLGNIALVVVLLAQNLIPTPMHQLDGPGVDPVSYLQQAIQGFVRPTQTPTSTPTAETPNETPIPTETPTPIVETPQPTETSIPVIELSFKVDPQYAKAGENFILYWQIEGVEKIKEGTFLRFYAPYGIVLLDAATLKVDEENGYVEVPVTETSGKLSWSIDSSTPLPTWITCELRQGEEVLAKSETELRVQEEFVISVSGGELIGLNEQVRVNFPEGALSESVMVKVGRPLTESLPVPSLSGAPFEITAYSENTKAEVSEFSKPIEIQVEYSEAGMVNEENTKLYWYDPSDGQWKLPLSQRIDTENNLIIASTDHFTIFDTYNAGWQTAITPTLDYFQHSGFTGAGSFSMPINVPPGPGGFQPSLSLSYSSSTVDNVSSQSQASWVGMGWSLTNSYIERVDGGLFEGSYQLNLNGMSMQLLPDENNQYHAADKNFYKVDFDVPVGGGEYLSAWTIWDKSGNMYVFDHRTYSVHFSPCGENGSEFTNHVWRWSLSKVVNIYGKEITYSYEDDIKGIYYNQCDGEPGGVQASTWVYPREIKYANQRYRILFERETSRLDYESLWDSPITTYFSYQKSLLDYILVQQDTTGFGNWTTIRKYDFTYCQSSNCSIFPNLVWSAGGRTPTLVSVQEFGLGGSQSLPAYTFTYGDGMHLTYASNGYGGSTAFTYDNWHEDIPFETGVGEPWENGILDYETPDWGNPLKYKFRQSKENWQGTSPYSGVTYNTSGPGLIKVWGVVQNPTVQSFQLGRWYIAVASVKADNTVGTHSIRLGIGTQSGTSAEWGPSSGQLSTSYVTITSGPIYLPADATDLYPKMDSIGINRVDWFYLFPLPTTYRVETRTLSAGGNDYAFSYDYEGATTNIPDPEISEAAAGGHPYINPYTEFRGHGTVTETDPYGKETVTSYYQTDCLSGRPGNTQVKVDGYAVQETTIDYTTPEEEQCTETEADLTLFDREDPLSPQHMTAYDPLKYRWVRTMSESKAVYSYTEGIHGILILDGTFSVLTEYGYESTYGNLVSQTVSGTDLPTLTTQIEYLPNPSGDTYIVGLPNHAEVTNGQATLAESFNLYEFNQNTRLTGATTRTLMRAGEYSQVDMDYDEWGNVTGQTAYSGYWTGAGNGSGAPSGARTMTTVYDSIYGTYPVSMTTPPVTGFPSGLTTNLTYDYARGVPISETGPNGAATTVSAEYDAFGRLVKLIRPGDDSVSPTLQIAYTTSPSFTVTLTQKINSGQSYTVSRVYDGMGRPTSVTAGGTSMLYQYGYENGARVDKVSTPYSGSEPYFWTNTKYDALGRPLTVTAPDNSVTSLHYNGLETRVQDANGNVTISTTDILGRTLSVNPATGPALAFDYDDMGNLLTAERGNATVTMEYDLAGRKTSMDDPDMGEWTYDYDALSNLKVQTDARGCTLTLNYDLLNRLDTKTSSGTCGQHVSVNYDYDAYAAGNNYGIGLRTSMTDGSGSTSWTYDYRGRVSSENKTIGLNSFLTQWTYNSADLPITMTYPDGEVVTNTYSNRMLPTGVTGTNVYAHSFVYDSAGRLTDITLGNNLGQKYRYKPWTVQGGRLDALVAGTGTWNETNRAFANTLQKSTYAYDTVGNVTSIYDSVWGETQTFGYDSLYRLTSASATGGLANYSESYGYNSTTGNLQTKGSLALQYLDTNHVHAATNAGVNTYSYDANGNQTTRIVGGQTVQLGYDAENRLITVTGTNLSAYFYYNGDGQRVKSIINSETTYFAGGYYEKKGSEISKYYFAGASRIAVRKYTVPQSTTLNYLTGDHLGSTSLAVNASTGEVVQTRYKPWGEVRWTSENKTLPTRYTFTGQYSYISDSATDLTASASFGLMFYNARWYDPALGRMAQADSVVPGGVQGLDRYAYVNNNPINYVDPSGHMVTEDDGGRNLTTSNCTDTHTYEWCQLNNGALLDSVHFRDGVIAWLTVLQDWLDGDPYATVSSSYNDKDFSMKFNLDGITSIEELREKFIAWYATVFQPAFEKTNGFWSRYGHEDIPSAVLGATLAAYATPTDPDKAQTFLDEFNMDRVIMDDYNKKFLGFLESLYAKAIYEFGGGGVGLQDHPWRYPLLDNKSWYFMLVVCGWWSCELQKIPYPEIFPYNILNTNLVYPPK